MLHLRCLTEFYKDWVLYMHGDIILSMAVIRCKKKVLDIRFIEHEFMILNVSFGFQFAVVYFTWSYNALVLLSNNKYWYLFEILRLNMDRLSVMLLLFNIFPNTRNLAIHPKNITEIIDSFSPRITDFYSEERYDGGMNLDVDNSSEKEATPSLWLITFCIILFKIIISALDTWR